MSGAGQGNVQLRQAASSPFLCLCALVRSSADWMLPAYTGEGIFFSVLIQMLIFSGKTLQTHTETMFY